MKQLELPPGDFLVTKEHFYSTQYYKGLSPEPRFKKVIAIARGLEKKPHRLLDVGCGDGTFTALLKKAAEAEEAFGLEIAAEAVSVAQQKGIKATRFDIDESLFPFDDNYFDMVYCGEVIEHLFNPDHLLEEIYRVLKPKGTGLISTPNLGGWPSRLALLLGYQPYPMAVSPKHESVGKFLIKGDEGQWGHIRLFTTRALGQLLSLHHFHINRFVGCPILVNSSLPPVLGGLVKSTDRLMARFPPLATRIIAVVEKA